MWPLQIIVVLATAVQFPFARPAASGDLQVKIEPHVKRVVFGDPIYIEVTIVNKLVDPISAPTPHPELGTLSFTVIGPYRSNDDPRPNVAAYGAPPTAPTTQFEPGKPATFYCYVFLTQLHLYDDTFWQPFVEGERIAISATYRDGKRWLGSSRAEHIQIVGRDFQELRTLERLDKSQPPLDEKGPLASDFGLPPLSRAQLATLTEKIETGELADLLLLVVRMQKIHDGPAVARAAAERELADWLARQPEIMRLALAYQVRAVALKRGMHSTAKAVEPLLVPDRR